jgi:hypothetical protein
LAGDLRRAFTAALAATTTGLDLPLLGGVHIEAGRGVLTATATDRFIAAHARVEVQQTDPCSLPSTMVAAAEVRTLLSALGRLKATEQVRILKPDGLVFRTDRWSIDIKCGDEKLPDMADVFAGKPHRKPVHSTAGVAPAEVGDLLRLDLGSTVIARVNAVLRAVARGKAVHWRINRTSAVAPVLVDAGDWLLLAVMPMRLQAGDVQHVIYGLPPEPPVKRVRTKKAAAAIEPAPKKTTRRRAA